MPQKLNTPKKRSRLDNLRLKPGQGLSDVADWSTVDPVPLIRLISTVSSQNGAVRFGYTRDGGAYSIGVYLDDDRETFYCRPGDDLSALLDDLSDKLTDGPG